MQKITGGYVLIKQPFIRTSIHKHTAALKTPVSQECLDAVNAIQRTPWQINREVAAIVQECWERGDHIAGLPDPEDKPLPPKMPDEEWEALDEKQKLAYKIRLATIHGENARMEGAREELLRKLQVARDLINRPMIWFPHNLDFRGRVYPICQDLHPQGDDLSKGLIRFGIGKPVGKAGQAWLASRLGANFGNGVDKLSHGDRIRWALDHEADIIDSAEDPLDGRRFWTEAEEPWQFLAACFEWRGVLLEGEAFVSHLPVNVDGTCSGIQHLSALGRDPVGAKAVNMMRDGGRQDIYSEVAGKVIAMVEADAREGRPEALHWKGKVTRATVKRGVMTTPYGLTHRGMRDQLIEDKHVEELVLANYMRDVMTKAIDETVVAARDIMGYLQDVAKTLAKHDIPFRWTTPSGMQVQQSYYGRALRAVHTIWGKVHLWQEDEQLGLSVGKQELAAAPNYVHSMDAAHLTKTVNKAHSLGIESFAVIHDSFGTHAADMPLLDRILREEFVAIYRDDWIAKLEAEVRKYAKGVELPERPPMGSFDIEEVLDAPFFFA